MRLWNGQRGGGFLGRRPSFLTTNRGAGSLAAFVSPMMAHQVSGRVLVHPCGRAACLGIAVGRRVGGSPTGGLLPPNAWLRASDSSSLVSKAVCCACCCPSCNHHVSGPRQPIGRPPGRITAMLALLDSSCRTPVCFRWLPAFWSPRASPDISVCCRGRTAKDVTDTDTPFPTPPTHPQPHSPFIGAVAARPPSRASDHPPQAPPLPPLRPHRQQQKAQPAVTPTTTSRPSRAAPTHH